MSVSLLISTAAVTARFHVTPRADLEAALRQYAETHGAGMVFHRVRRGHAWDAIIIKSG